eukprot:tig00000411_g527.t1
MASGAAKRPCTVLICVDGSRASDEAVDTALDTLLRPGDRVVLFCATEEVSSAALFPSYPTRLGALAAPERSEGVHVPAPAQLAAFAASLRADIDRLCAP